ncbi:hypothetical protein PCCS19_54330 [Paenibacillus sp. CCS19]|uniref:hypothetical protein n=1 Tax=Paenibacillus sp. CCS19 TaxID=3158387 RepID=UPI002562D0B5|nr:hypothetical protein [Paenibacillus cellulosilyticus]GMK42374.1 hypothetical protein PCCS19_54330 [Paenibacillus cellulosilyticus]
MEKELNPTHSTTVLNERQKENFTIKYTNSAENDEYIAIYFSSNGIYFPNTLETFEHTIINRNRYEWTSNLIQKAHKHIFVRDLFKQWYLEGISSELNTIETVLSLLRRETAGKKIITVGSSAGGYASILFGTMLNAEIIFSFAPQLSLRVWAQESQAERDPLLFKHFHNKAVNQYYDLKDYIERSRSYVFYFAPANSTLDIPQVEVAQSISNIKMFKFTSSKHGVPFTLPALTSIMNRDTSELIDLYNKYKGKEINPLLFSVKIAGLYPNIRMAIKKIQKKLKR